MDNFEGIQFIAKLGDWVSIKKLKVEKGVEAKDIAEFLISLSASIEQAIERYLAEEIDFSVIENAVNDALTRENALYVLQEPSVKRALKDSIKRRSALDKKEVKCLEELAAVYALRHALKKSGYKHSYSQVELPTLKLAKKLSKKIK